MTEDELKAIEARVSPETMFKPESYERVPPGWRDHKDDIRALLSEVRRLQERMRLDKIAFYSCRGYGGIE